VFKHIICFSLPGNENVLGKRDGICTIMRQCQDSLTVCDGEGKGQIKGKEMVL